MSKTDLEFLLNAMEQMMGGVDGRAKVPRRIKSAGKKGLKLTYQFKVQIRGIKKPPVWRRVLVPSQFTFAGFHAVIQKAFGWWNEHLYCFGDTPYSQNLDISEPSEENWTTPTHNALKYTLGEFFGEEMTNGKQCYVYDFGDDWIHDITLEKVLPEPSAHASCLAGKGACPDEDCGGPWVYEELKEAGEVDPHEFDLEEADEEVRQAEPEGMGACSEAEEYYPQEIFLSI